MVLPEHVFSAAVNGRMDVLREYFASGDRDLNDALERNGWTLLGARPPGPRLRLGAGAPDGRAPPDAFRASPRHRVAEPAPARRLQAGDLVLGSQSWSVRRWSLT